MLLTDIHQNFVGEHFQRNAIAESYLRTLSSGLMLSTTIYAPRNTGLTSFLLHDVMATSISQSYLPVYVDLSQPHIPTVAAFVRGLEHAVSEASFLGHGLNYFKSIFSSKEGAGFHAGRYGNQQETADAAYFSGNMPQHLSVIDAHLEKLMAYKSVLLVVDHAHMLGKDLQSREFVDYLAKKITRFSHALKPLYATHDMNAWGGVFQTRSSALFSEGACVHKLPVLGEDFVQEVVVRSGYRISMDEAMISFDLTGHCPSIFITLLMTWAQTRHLPLSSLVYQHMQQHTAAEQRVASPRLAPLKVD